MVFITTLEYVSLVNLVILNARPVSRGRIIHVKAATRLKEYSINISVFSDSSVQVKLSRTSTIAQIVIRLVPSVLIPRIWTVRNVPDLRTLLNSAIYLLTNVDFHVLTTTTVTHLLINASNAILNVLSVTDITIISVISVIQVSISTTPPSVWIPVLKINGIILTIAQPAIHLVIGKINS